MNCTSSLWGMGLSAILPKLRLDRIFTGLFLLFIVWSIVQKEYNNRYKYENILIHIVVLHFLLFQYLNNSVYAMRFVISFCSEVPWKMLVDLIKSHIFRGENDTAKSTILGNLVGVCGLFPSQFCDCWRLKFLMSQWKKAYRLGKHSFFLAL